MARIARGGRSRVMYAARSCQQHPCPEAHVAYCTAAGRASCPERRREDVMPFMRRDPVRRGGRAAVCVPLMTADPTTSPPADWVRARVPFLCANWAQSGHALVRNRGRVPLRPSELLRASRPGLEAGSTRARAASTGRRLPSGSRPRWRRRR